MTDKEKRVSSVDDDIYRSVLKRKNKEIELLIDRVYELEEQVRCGRVSCKHYDKIATGCRR